MCQSLPSRSQHINSCSAHWCTCGIPRSQRFSVAGLKPLWKGAAGGTPLPHVNKELLQWEGKCAVGHNDLLLSICREMNWCLFLQITSLVYKLETSDWLHMHRKAFDVLEKPRQPADTDLWVLISFCLLKQRPHAGISAPIIFRTNHLIST